MVKNLLQCGRPRFSPWVRKIPWGRAWQPTSVSLPGESYGQSSLVGYSPWGCRESDATERLTFSLSKKYWESYWVSCPGIVQRMWSSQGPWNRIVLYTALDSLEKGKLCPNLSQLDMEGKVGTFCDYAFLPLLLQRLLTALPTCIHGLLEFILKTAAKYVFKNIS